MDCRRALGPILGHCAHMAKERMDARLSGCGGTPVQTHVLLYLYHHGRQAAQRDVTAFLRVKPSTANGILDRMEEKGLVRRSISGSDARQRLITLTDAGAARHQRLRQAFQETEEAAFRGFSPEEREALLGMLERVMRNLEEDRNRC